MSFDLIHIWANMGPVAKVIAAVLGLMAVACVGVAVERWWAFRKAARSTKLFLSAIREPLGGWDVEGVIRFAEEHHTSPLARLFSAMCQRYRHGHDSESSGGLSPVELARNESERAQETIGADLRRGMGILASVGSVAPFVGLLGTVVGIIAAFQGIASAGSGGLGAVSAGIAEALIETAFGLMTAIPAVLLFNYFSARVAAMERRLAGSASELLDDMEDHDGRPSQTQLSTQAA